MRAVWVVVWPLVWPTDEHLLETGRKLLSNTTALPIDAVSREAERHQQLTELDKQITIVYHTTATLLSLAASQPRSGTAHAFSPPRLVGLSLALANTPVRV